MWILAILGFFAFCWVVYQLSLVKAAIINVRKAIRKEAKLDLYSLEVLIGLFFFIVCTFIALLPWFD